jgi:hypothetical protein
VEIGRVRVFWLAVVRDLSARRSACVGRGRTGRGSGRAAFDGLALCFQLGVDLGERGLDLAWDLARGRQRRRDDRGRRRNGRTAPAAARANPLGRGTLDNVDLEAAEDALLLLVGSLVALAILVGLVALFGLLVFAKGGALGLVLGLAI